MTKDWTERTYEGRYTNGVRKEWTQMQEDFVRQDGEKCHIVIN